MRPKSRALSVLLLLSIPTIRRVRFELRNIRVLDLSASLFIHPKQVAPSCRTPCSPRLGAVGRPWAMMKGNYQILTPALRDLFEAGEAVASEPNPAFLFMLILITFVVSRKATACFLRALSRKDSMTGLEGLVRRDRRR